MKFIGVIALCAVLAGAYLYYMGYFTFDVTPTQQGQVVVDQGKDTAKNALNSGIRRIQEEVNENTMPSP